MVQKIKNAEAVAEFFDRCYQDLVKENIELKKRISELEVSNARIKELMYG